MKKFLSLVLALVMTMSLVTVAAGAKDFTDSKEIKYTEAVDVMSGINIIDGFSAGDFQPTGILTRGQASKIIACMMLGKTTAESLGVDKAPFKDVAKNSTFAGYIAFCVESGIVDGYADGTFKPGATLTGYQFLKMLLTALGYDSKIEGFTGNNWTVNVAKLAIEKGLTKGNADFLGTAKCTREEACLYALNTLLATKVEYENKGTNINLGTGSIAIGASKAKSVAQTGFSNTMKDSDSPNTLQFAEQHQAKLIKNTKLLDGRTGRNFSFKGTEVSKFTSDDTLLASNLSGTTLAKLVTSSDSKYIGYENETYVNVYANGTALTGASAASGKTTADYSLAELKALTTYDSKRGVEFSFIDNGDNGKYDVLCITLDAVAKVAATPTTTTSGAVTSVTVSGVPGLSKVNAKNVFGYDGLVKGDYVVWHTDGTNFYLTKCSSVVGKMTATVGTDSVVVDGTTYKMSDINAVESFASAKGNLGKDETTLYLDKGGYVVKTTSTSASVSLTNVLFVRGASKDNGFNVQSKVIFADGTSSVITVKKVNSTNATELANVGENTFYTYVKNDDGTYNLKTPTTKQLVKTTYETKDEVAFTKGVANFFTDTNAAKQNILATSATVFVIGNNTDNGYNVFTGIANAPTVKAPDADTLVAATLCNSDGYAIFAVAFGGNSVNLSSKSDKVFLYGTPTEVYVENGNNYFTYSAVVNGEIKTIDVTNTATVSVNTLYSVVSYDGGKLQEVNSDSLMTPTAATNDDISVSGNTVAYLNNGVVVGSLVMTDDAKVFVYDTTASPKTMTESTLDEIAALTGDNYTLQAVQVSGTDAAVKQLFVTISAAAADTAIGTAVLTGTGATAVTVNNTAHTLAATGLTKSTTYTLKITTDPNAIVTYSTDNSTYVASNGSADFTASASASTATTIYFKVGTQVYTVTMTTKAD